MTNRDTNIGKHALYYPFGKDGDSIEVEILGKRKNLYYVEPTDKGRRDIAYFYGTLGDDEHEIMSGVKRYELRILNKK